jgi:2-methylcitrate dehydratase
MMSTQKATRAEAEAAPDALRDATSRIVANFACTRFEDLPEKAVRATKNRVLDLIGCAIGGAGAAGNAALVDVLKAQGNAPQSSLIGYPGKLSAGNAAMANAICARSFDFEVMTTVVAGMVIPSHTSPTTVMTALAVAERERRSGREFLTALTLGDDLVARVLGGAGFDFGKGWDAASVHTGLGAAAIAAKLMGLPEQQIGDAVGMSVNLIGGTIQAAWEGSTDFKLPQGMAARNGVLAAELAAAGWTGMADALNAPWGFYRQFTSGCIKPEVLTEGLGEVYWAEEYFKPYPACAATHGSIETALALHARPDFSVAQLRRLTLYLPQRLLTNFCIKPYEPRRFPHCDAIFSYRFQVANVLLNGITRQEHYAEARLRDPALLDLTTRIDLAPLEDSNAGGWSSAGGSCLIVAEMTDGRRIEQRLGKLSRHPSVRASTDEEIEAKFRQQIEFSGRKLDADAILAAVRELDRAPDLTGLLALIVP